MLCSRNFLDARLSASGIKKPSLKSCTGLLRKMLVQLRVIHGGSCASGCENRRHTGAPMNCSARQFRRATKSTTLTLCVNPAHLEVLTPVAHYARHPTTAGLLTGHCRHGHLLAGDNLVVRGGRRCCRTCEGARDRSRPRRSVTDHLDPARRNGYATSGRTAASG